MEELFDCLSGVTIARIEEPDTAILEIDCRLLKPEQATEVEETLRRNSCLLSVKRYERNGDDPYCFLITKKPKDDCYWRMLYSILRDAVARISSEVEAIQRQTLLSLT